MDKKVAKFGGTEIEKYKFHQHKSHFSIKNIDINKLIISNQFSFCKKDFKYCVDYKQSKKVRPLRIFLPRITVYSGKNHNISTYPFLFIIRRFECYYTHCQETALN